MNKVAGLREIMLSNAYIRSTFRLGDDDAQVLAKSSPHFEPSDFANLGTGDVILRVGKAQDECTMKTLLIDEQRDTTEVERIIFKLYDIEAPQQKEKEPEEIIQEEAPPQTELTDFEKSKQKFHEKEVVKKKEREHRRIQESIVTLARTRGFRADIEKEFGGGRADVLLENDEIIIAVEVTVTNTVEYEVGNIRKCLSGKADAVALIANDTKKRNKLRKKIETEFSKEEQAKILLTSEDEFEVWLQSVSIPQEKEQRIGGFKVKVKYDKTASEEELAKRVVEIMRGRKGGK